MGSEHIQQRVFALGPAPHGLGQGGLGVKFIVPVVEALRHTAGAHPGLIEEVLIHHHDQGVGQALLRQVFQKILELVDVAAAAARVVEAVGGEEFAVELHAAAGAQHQQIRGLAAGHQMLVVTGVVPVGKAQEGGLAVQHHLGNLLLGAPFAAGVYRQSEHAAH